MKIFKLFSGFTGISKTFIWFSEELWKSISEKTKPGNALQSIFVKSLKISVINGYTRILFANFAV